MTVSAIQAAKFLSKQSDWRYTHLEIQKILYLTHMVYLGKFKEPLVTGKFEAWEYGPVHTELHQILLEWGNVSIPASAGVYQTVDISIFDSGAAKEARLLRVSAKSLPPGNGPKLLAITNANVSAWTKAYDNVRRSRIITDEAILKEYEDRICA